MSKRKTSNKQQKTNFFKSLTDCEVIITKHALERFMLRKNIGSEAKAEKLLRNYYNNSTLVRLKKDNKELRYCKGCNVTLVCKRRPNKVIILTVLINKYIQIENFSDRIDRISYSDMGWEEGEKNEQLQ